MMKLAQLSIRGGYLRKGRRDLVGIICCLQNMFWHPPPLTIGPFGINDIESTVEQMKRKIEKIGWTKLE